MNWYSIIVTLALLVSGSFNIKLLIQNQHERDYNGRIVSYNAKKIIEVQNENEKYRRALEAIDHLMQNLLASKVQKAIEEAKNDTLFYTGGLNEEDGVLRGR